MKEADERMSELMSDEVVPVYVLVPVRTVGKLVWSSTYSIPGTGTCIPYRALYYVPTRSRATYY
jgi:hypothetical protein